MVYSRIAEIGIFLVQGALGEDLFSKSMKQKSGLIFSSSPELLKLNFYKQDAKDITDPIIFLNSSLLGLIINSY